MPKQKDELSDLQRDFSDEEISRRRDAVINRMANTPPRPNTTGLLHKRRTKAGASRVARKDHVGRER